MEFDCFLESPTYWFRYRAAAVIMENGCVLMAKTKGVDYYYSVGGGVHLHESAEQAVKREVFEETGVEFEVDRLLFVHENFFKDNVLHQGKACHEICFYFLMKSRGTQELPSHTSCSSVGEEKVYWLPIKNFGQYKAYPEFFKDELLNLPAGVKHIVTREY